MKNAVNLLMVAMLATGCASEVPIPTTYPVTTQQKIKSAHHWDVIAKDSSEQIAASLAKLNLGGTQLYVLPSETNASFQKGFRNLLITQLVNAGQSVGQKAGDVEIQFETQLVRHASPRTASVPGQLTALAAGILVIHNAALHWGDDQLVAGGLALTGLLDWGKGYATSLPNTEVIVTTSVVRGGKYLMRKTDVYYLDDADGSLFEQMRQWRVVG